VKIHDETLHRNAATLSYTLAGGRIVEAVRADLTGADVVDVESGRYRGCRLTRVGRVNGWHVCLNSNEPGGYVRVREVSFVRESGSDEGLDPVMLRHYYSRIAFAREMTGAK
jgi:hypothetical protein